MKSISGLVRGSGLIAVHGKTWGKKGETPVVERPGQRQSISAASAVSASGGFWYSTYHGGLNAELFVTLLRRMMRHRTKPVHLVLDGLPAHKTALVKSYAASTNGMLTLHFLPGYAPELNPDELVWSHVKRTGVARAPLRRGETLHDKIEAQLSAIKRMPQPIRSFFTAPSVAYITDVGAILAETHALHAHNTDGEVSQVYPRARPRRPRAVRAQHRAGPAATSTKWATRRHPFTIMSVSKPFLLALVCQAIGWEAVRSRVGANATGMAFNSLAAVEVSADGRTNPMVNSGAIATTSLVPGDGPEARWRFIHECLSRFAGRELAVDAEVYASATETNFRNRSIVHLLHTRGRVYCDPLEAVDLYTKQCALSVTAHDLAAMGATLAAGGVNPLTHETVVDATACRYALAVMATAGMFQTWATGSATSVCRARAASAAASSPSLPGKGGFGSFSPPLDPAGNSVRGVLAARSLSERLGLDLFVSAPVD